MSGKTGGSLFHLTATAKDFVVIYSLHSVVEFNEAAQAGAA